MTSSLFCFAGDSYESGHSCVLTVWRVSCSALASFSLVFFSPRRGCRVKQERVAFLNGRRSHSGETIRRLLARATLAVGLEPAPFSSFTVHPRSLGCPAVKRQWCYEFSGLLWKARPGSIAGEAVSRLQSTGLRAGKPQSQLAYLLDRVQC